MAQWTTNNTDQWTLTNLEQWTTEGYVEYEFGVTRYYFETLSINYYFVAGERTFHFDTLPKNYYFETEVPHGQIY